MSEELAHAIAIAQCVAVATFVLGFFFGMFIMKAAIAAQLSDDE